MIFTETKLPGAYIIDPERIPDSRGFFTRTFCSKDFEKLGLNPVNVQSNLAFNFKQGTLRGMHFQFPPFAETKLVRCTKGAIEDIIVDLRPESPTYLQSIEVELTEDNHRALYVPERFGHGYQTLVDDTEVYYDIGEIYTPEAACGLRYNDPRLNLKWPLPVSEVSEKDKGWYTLDKIETTLKARMTVGEDVNKRLDEIQPHYIR